MPSVPRTGSIRVAIAGSARAPMPREQIVIPSWQTAKYWSSLLLAAFTSPAEACPSSRSRSTCVPRILTKANSAATNRPFKATSNNAAKILRAGKPSDAKSRTTPS